MKQRILMTALLALSLLSSLSYADVSLQTKEEIAGTWKLDTTKNSLTDRRPFQRSDTWVFKDGTLTILHIAREDDFYDQSPEPYDIEGGKIKVMTVGSSRSELYTVVEKSDTNVVLKGKYGTYYYFTKK